MVITRAEASIILNIFELYVPYVGGLDNKERAFGRKILKEYPDLADNLDYPWIFNEKNNELFN